MPPAGHQPRTKPHVLDAFVGCTDGTMDSPRIANRTQQMCLRGTSDCHEASLATRQTQKAGAIQKYRSGVTA